MSSQQPVISIIMLAYNHEPYIAQAIEGVLNQHTDIAYELVIGEDFSTDNTRAIINDFKKRYPEKIKVIESATNVGMHENLLRTLFSCAGKYVCVCEGDDYWDSPDKLAIQYQFLEANPAYVLVCGNHRKYIQNINAFDRGDSATVKDHDITFEKLIRFNCITTATIMFRNVLKREDFTQDFFSIISCDWYMYMKLLNHGKIRYLNHIFAVYRINEGSINGSTNRLKIAEKEMDFMQLVKNGNLVKLDRKKIEALDDAMLLKQYDFANAHAFNGNRKEAFKLSVNALRKNPWNFVSLTDFTKSIILIVSPNFFQTIRNVKRAFRNM